MKLLQSAALEYPQDEARATVRQYLANCRDEGTVAALESFKRDTSPEFLRQLFGDESDSKRAYLEAVLARLTSEGACFPREVITVCRDAISTL